MGEKKDSQKQDFKINRCLSMECLLCPCMFYIQYLLEFLVISICIILGGPLWVAFYQLVPSDLLCFNFFVCF